MNWDGPRRQSEIATKSAGEGKRFDVRRSLRDQKRTVEQAVEQVIAAEAAENDDEDERDYGELYNDLYERLNDFEDYSDFRRKSTGEIVEQICRPLGLPFDLALWQDEPWAIAEAKAKPAGSPFADLPDTANDDEDDEPRTARGTGPP